MHSVVVSPVPVSGAKRSGKTLFCFFFLVFIFLLKVFDKKRCLCAARRGVLQPDFSFFFSLHFFFFGFRLVADGGFRPLLSWFVLYRRGGVRWDLPPLLWRWILELELERDGEHVFRDEAVARGVRAAV